MIQNRTTAPPPPKLPFPTTEENRQRLQDYLLTFCASSTFNVCPHQPLSLMHGPPLDFVMKPDANPYAVHTPATVAAHLEKKVKADLDRGAQESGARGVHWGGGLVSQDGYRKNAQWGPKENSRFATSE